MYNFQTVVLNITQGCNLRCAYCQVSKNPKIMSYETLEKALNWVKNNVECPYVSFFGGEPLTEYDKIKWAIEHFPEIRFGTSTNVTLLTPDKLKFLFDHGVHFLFSVDGIGEVHDLTRDNSWDQIKDMLPILGELYSDQVFRITITPKNVRHLCETVYLAHQLGFTNFNALPDGMSDNWTADDYKALKEQLQLLWNDPEYRRYFRPFKDYKYRLEHPEDMTTCCDGKVSISILTDGRLSLCGEQTDDNIFIVGDIENGIDDEKVKNFWSQVQPCQIHCKAFNICSKERCFSRRYFIYNDLSHRVPNHCRWYNIMEEVINSGVK